MKKIYIFTKVSLTLGILVFLIAVFSGFGNEEKISENIQAPKIINPISKLIAEKKNTAAFDKVSLFEFKGNGDEKAALKSFVNKSVLLEINSENLKQILREGKENIELNIPVSETMNYTLELTRVSVLDKDFAMISKSNHDEKTTLSNLGIHYRGILKGDEKSWAAISIFNDFVMGLIATENGNFVLGSIKNDRNKYTSDYVLYNDRNLLKSSNFKCGDGDNEDKFVRNHKVPMQNEGNIADYSSVDTVAIYFETDNQMYQDANGNLTQLANFVSGIFNQVAALYQNESLPIKIANIGYWAHQDPYANDTDSYVILQRFGSNHEDNFTGDLAHLLSTGHNQQLGGIAWINVLCTQYNSTDYSGRFAFSNIENTYSPYPTYSWTVTVVAHEMGHNFGSYHTHACHWPNGFGIGPIDTCVVTGENSSYFDGCVPIYPTNGCVRPRLGTLMSYCHFCAQYGGGINLSYGFGPMPGDTVRIWYQRASCLHYETNSSEMPVTYDLLQNYPNPFNPTTNIKYALPEDGFVTLTLFDITGREVARLVEGKFFNAGIYSHVVDANALNMSSGVYFYRLNVTRDSKKVYSEIRKMVLIK